MKYNHRIHDWRAYEELFEKRKRIVNETAVAVAILLGVTAIYLALTLTHLLDYVTVYETLI